MSEPQFRIISSPCIQVCKIGPETGICSGCGRSLSEIATWSKMTEAERLGLMAILPARIKSAVQR